MPYRFLEETATADIAFEAKGETLEELFVAAAEATTNTMILELSQLARKEKRDIRIESKLIDLLLFDFLQEIVFYKDADLLLFGQYSVKIDPGESRFRLQAEAYGEPLDPARHDLVVDVKAVTLHQFEIKETSQGWKARVVLDI